MCAAHLLLLMYRANKLGGTKIPNSEFYNNRISDSLDLHAEYEIWARHVVRSCTCGCAVRVRVRVRVRV